MKCWHCCVTRRTVKAQLFLFREPSEAIAYSDFHRLLVARQLDNLYAQQDTDVTFDDIAGIDEAEAELKQIVEFLRNPERYRRLCGKIPKGVLIVGAPGTGKMLLAKAVAGATGHTL
jgi:ATP-dependent Zn protease